MLQTPRSNHSGRVIHFWERLNVKLKGFAAVLNVWAPSIHDFHQHTPTFWGRWGYQISRSTMKYPNAAQWLRLLHSKMHKVIDPILLRRPTLLLPGSAASVRRAPDSGGCIAGEWWKRGPEPWLTWPDWSCIPELWLEMQNMLSRLEDLLFERQEDVHFFCSCSEIKTGLQVAAVENEVWVHRSPKLVFAKSVRLRLFRMLHFKRKMLCPAGQNCNEKGSILLQWRFGQTSSIFGFTLSQVPRGGCLCSPG